MSQQHQQQQQPTSAVTISTRTERGLYNFIAGPGGAATIAGSCEIAIFHPFDTASKRLMKNTSRVFVPGQFRMTMDNMRRVVLDGATSSHLAKLSSSSSSASSSSGQQGGRPLITATTADAATLRQARALTSYGEYFRYLYPGSIYAIYYKVSQRCIKFAGQPYMKDYLDPHHHSGPTAGGGSGGFSFAATAQSWLGVSHGKMLVEATAGVLVGVTEIVLLPIDRMKVLAQTNTTAVQGRGLLRCLMQEGLLKMYAAAGTTAARNCLGSFLLFGGAALTKEYVFALEDYRRATLFQNTVSGTVGACLGVISTSPLDVVKTRLQAKNFRTKAAGSDGAVGGLSVTLETLRREGVTAFYKGITPKLMASAPRLVFSFTLSQQLTSWFRGRSGGGGSNTKQ